MALHRLRVTAIFALASAFAIFAAAPAAQAGTYYLDGVTFSDGTTATGYFTTNSYGYLSSWDIVTVAGTIAGNTYASGDITAPYNPGDSAIEFIRGSYDGDLYLAAVGPIDGASPAVALLTGGSSFECLGATSPCTATRDIVSGFLTTAPEPASWGLMLVGFCAMGIALRRRRISNGPWSKNTI